MAATDARTDIAARPHSAALVSNSANQVSASKPTRAHRVARARRSDAAAFAMAVLERPRTATCPARPSTRSLVMQCAPLCG
jgi:hypothetical protein